MNTFEKDGLIVEFDSDLSRRVRFQYVASGGKLRLPPGFLQAWLSHAGYVLVPKESMAGFYAQTETGYDAEKMRRKLEGFFQAKVVGVEDRRKPRAFKDDSEEGDR